MDASSQLPEKSESVAISLEQNENEVEPPPFLSTRLLCPSNLGAIFESTTVSFVSGGWKEPTVEVKDDVVSEQLDNCVKESDCTAVSGEENE